jgi:hypothetical protein
MAMGKFHGGTQRGAHQITPGTAHFLGDVQKYAGTFRRRPCTPGVIVGPRASDGAFDVLERGFAIARHHRSGARWIQALPHVAIVEHLPAFHDERHVRRRVAMARLPPGDELLRPTDVRLQGEVRVGLAAKLTAGAAFSRPARFLLGRRPLPLSIDGVFPVAVLRPPGRGGGVREGQ